MNKLIFCNYIGNAFFCFPAPGKAEFPGVGEGVPRCRRNTHLKGVWSGITHCNIETPKLSIRKRMIPCWNSQINQAVSHLSFSLLRFIRPILVELSSDSCCRFVRQLSDDNSTAVGRISFSKQEFKMQYCRNCCLNRECSKWETGNIDYRLGARRRRLSGVIEAMRSLLKRRTLSLPARLPVFFTSTVKISSSSAVKSALFTFRLL